MSGVREVSVTTFPSSFYLGSEFISQNICFPHPGEAKTICKLIRSAPWPYVNNLQEGQLVLWNLKMG